jgi:hypothetical protein
MNSLDKIKSMYKVSKSQNSQNLKDNQLEDNLLQINLTGI